MTKNKNKDKNEQILDFENMNEEFDDLNFKTIETEMPVLEENYAPGSVLNVPEKVRQKFAEEGYDLFWVRVYVDNALDGKHILQKEREGYSFVRSEEIGNAMSSSLSSFFGKELNKHEGLVLIGDLALAKISKKLKERKTLEKEEKTRMRNKGIIRDMRENSIKGEYRTTRSGSQEDRDVEFQRK